MKDGRFYYSNNYLNSVVYEYSNLFRYMELAFYSVVCFALPIILKHPQLVVGTVVNAILILSAYYLKSYELLPSILFPSIGVVAGAALFGSLTAKIIVMVPFIWAGNAILVLFFKVYKVVKKQNFAIVLLKGALAKSLFLGAAALGLIIAGFLPKVFLLPFSVLQLETALLGGALAYVITIARAKLLEVN